MKRKILSLVVAIITICIAAASCVTIPINESQPPEESSEITSTTGTSSEEAPSEESPNSSEAEPSSEEPSDEPSADTSEPVSEEPSDEPSEESSEEPSVVLDLPYPTVKNLKKSDITTSELDSYFNDSMFVGNSICIHYLNFLDSVRYKNPGFMGDAFVFAASSWSARHDLMPITDDSVHPKYKGEKMKCADAVEKSGVSRVFLTVMALNDIGMGRINTCVDETYSNMVKLIESIRTKTPDVEIVVLSSTYLTYSSNDEYNSKGSKMRNHNGNYSALNNLMLDYCNLNNIDYIDVSTDLMDGNVLKKDLSRDDYCHLTNDAYAIWTGVLRNYAYLKQNNAYKNPETMPVYTPNK